MMVYHNEQLRRKGTPPVCDILPSEINNENYFLLIKVLFELNLITFHVTQLVEGWSSE